jgi:hypothetical protein
VYNASKLLETLLTRMCSWHGAVALRGSEVCACTELFTGLRLKRMMGTRPRQEYEEGVALVMIGDNLLEAARVQLGGMDGWLTVPEADAHLRHTTTIRHRIGGQVEEIEECLVGGWGLQPWVHPALIAVVPAVDRVHDGARVRAEGRLEATARRQLGGVKESHVPLATAFVWHRHTARVSMDEQVHEDAQPFEESATRRAAIRPDARLSAALSSGWESSCGRT